MKLSFSTIGCPELSWQDTVALAKDSGFQGIELRGIQQIPVEEVLQALERLRTGRLEIACISTNTNMRTAPEAGLAEARLAIEIAAQLHAPYVRVLSGRGDPTTPAVEAAAENLPAALASELPDLLRLAERCGVTLLVETNGVFADTKRLAQLLGTLQSDHVGALWDIHHTYRYGGESPAQTVENLGSYIKHVHCKDSLLVDGNVQYCLMGEGDVPLDKFFQALHSIRYEGFISYEWMRLNSPALEDYGVAFPRFVDFMQPYLHRQRQKTQVRLYDNETKTGQFIWPKGTLINLTLPEILATVADTFPDQNALVTDTATWTYKEFQEETDRVGRALIALGVRAHDHVAIWAPNIAEYFFTFWACASIGATMVTMNTAYKIREAEYLLRHADIHTLIMAKGFKDSDYAATMQELCPELHTHDAAKKLYTKALPFLRNIVTIGFDMPGAHAWEQFLEMRRDVPEEALQARLAAVTKDDVVNIQYTSGTTGFPKGVMLTHANVVNTSKCFGDVMDLSTADRMIIMLPMFHAFALVDSMLVAMTHGTAMHLMAAFSPVKVLERVQADRITVMHGVPTMFHALLTHPASATTDFSSLRTGASGGSSAPPLLFEKLRTQWGFPELMTGYGQTESGAVLTLTTRNETIETLATTVGRALPGVECKIINPETGEDLPDGMDGEFVARGYNVMQGYYKSPEATAAAIEEDGWLHTGDIAQRDAEGNFKITGRIKDMIIRGGENLFPKELEDFFFDHPKVFDVQVVGVPDPQYGEEVCAFVIPAPGQTVTEEELKEYALAHIAKEKVPRYIRFVNEFPLNASGKIMKYKLRAQAVQELGLSKN